MVLFILCPMGNQLHFMNKIGYKSKMRSEFWIRLFLPLVIGVTTRLFYPFNEESQLEIHPSPILFAVIWAFLYLAIGTAWNFAAKTNSRRADFEFIILSGLLAGWVYLYQGIKARKWAITVLLVAATLTLSLAFYYQGKVAMLLAPVFVWLLYAILLNCFAVELE
jgi:tryptophan-rich sensory protein